MAALDLVVVGAGPGGYVAAIRAAQLGLRTAVVERDRAGGVCGNWGCIPSKAILADAELYRAMRDGASRGMVADGLRLDFARVIARSREVAAQQARGVESLLRKHEVTLVQGHGALVADGVEVAHDGAAPERLAAQHVLLATGSRERTLPGLDVDGTVVQTSREALEDVRLPASVIIVGGGAIGVEFAYAYASFGARVTIVEMEPTLLPGMDVDLGRELARAFSKQRVEVLTGHRFERLERAAPGRGHRARSSGAWTPPPSACSWRSAAPLTEAAPGSPGRTDHGRRDRCGDTDDRRGVSAIGDLVGAAPAAHRVRAGRSQWSWRIDVTVRGAWTSRVPCACTGPGRGVA